MKMSFAPLVHQVTPAVVNVYATRVEKLQPNPLLDDPFFRRFFGGGDADAARAGAELPGLGRHRRSRRASS